MWLKASAILLYLVLLQYDYLEICIWKHLPIIDTRLQIASKILICLEYAANIFTQIALSAAVSDNLHIVRNGIIHLIPQIAHFVRSMNVPSTDKLCGP